MMRDGRYEGSNHEFLVDVRIDVGVCGLVSADLFDAAGPRHQHVASVRTRPGIELTEAGGDWPALYQDHDGATTAGRMAVVPRDADQATVTFHADEAIGDLPAAADVVAEVRWAAPELRRLGLEMETEQGVTVPETLQLNGAGVTFKEMLRQAGFQVRDIGRASTIPRRESGWPWDESVVYDVLHDVMRRSADDGLDLPAWKVHVLRLARPVREGMFGVMFDMGGLLPRQGCAIFVDEIREFTPPALVDQRIFHTLAHEVGHAFNLAHRFERVIGRADSTSVMNYPDKFRDGEDEYWKRCGFVFDPDELGFLRHGPRSAVMPGTAPFHAIDYWSAAPDHRPPTVPDAPTPGFELRLEPPDNNGVFAFGQQIFLGVTLRNTGAAPLPAPAELLDIKAGYLEVLVEAVSAGTGAQSFAPMMRRCYSAAVVDRTPGPPMLRPGDEAIRDNVNLSFGAGGFAMAEPGAYRLTPLVAVDHDGRVIRGETLTVEVAPPADRRAEQQATRLLQPDVGAWFALGGSRALAKAGDEVREVLRQRTHRSGPDRPDPIVAAINRTLAIHASRTSVELDGDDFRPRPADVDFATKTLEDVVTNPAAARSFDPSTLASTRDLLTRLRGDGR